MSGRAYPGVSLNAVKDKSVADALRTMDTYLRDSSKGSAKMFGQPTTDGSVASASYLTLANHTLLTGERKFVTGTGLTGTDSGANSTYSLAVNVGAIAGTPAIVLGTAAAAGSAATLVRTDATIVAFNATVPEALAAAAATGSAAFAARRDHVHLFPTTLQTSNSIPSTIVLTDNDVDQTLTGNLGQLNLRSAANTLSLPFWMGGAGNNATVGTVLQFNATSSALGTSLATGVQATMTFGGDGNTYASQIHSGIKTSVTDAATSGTTVTSGTLQAFNGTVLASAFTTTSTWTERSGLVLTLSHPTQSGAGAVTVTDTWGLRIAMQGALGTAGTYTNAAGIKTDIPAWGSTIRRGLHVATTTTNRGTASANTEGVYVEDITIGTAQRANFYAEGATTGTPTDVYALFQGTAHVVGTNRYGARFTGATTGAPTLAIGVQCDAHAVGTTKRSFIGVDPAQFGGIVLDDATDIVVNATTGTKIGTATTQKIGLWNKAPVVQPATTGRASSWVAGAGLNVVLDLSTFTGSTGATAYTIDDVIYNLKNCGILAA